MDTRLLKLTVSNFRTLAKVSLPLGPLTVLVGPNAAGKSNVFHAFDFLANVVQSGIEPTLAALGTYEVGEPRLGYDEVAYRGGKRTTAELSIGVEGLWTEFATEADPDRYDLSLLYRRRPGEVAETQRILSRSESLVQHIAPDSRSTIEVMREAITVSRSDGTESAPPKLKTGRLDSVLHTGLNALPPGLERAAVQALSSRFGGVRVFEVDVRAARKPAPITSDKNPRLKDDGSNLADFLKDLKRDHDAWDAFMEDIRAVLPSIEDIDIRDITQDRIAVELQERGLRGRTTLRDASFGTVRLLCLLALFHDPNPQVLTCIEEIDHGIHPHSLELLAHRLREASERTQFLVTTHSPVFVNQLELRELVVCERDDLGRSRIPAISQDLMHEVIVATEGMPPGEVWFSGALGGGSW